MARVENVFALLGDGDGDDDVSALLERVAAVKAEPPPLEKKKKDKQQQHQKQPVEKEESDWGLDDAVSMKAKPIVLPDYVTRRDIVVRKNEPEGRERRQGRGSDRSEPGGRGYQRNFGGSDGYKRNNGGRNGNQRKSDDNGGGSGYHGNNGGENDFQRNVGAESGNAVGDDWQEQGRGRGGGGRGRGRGRGRGGGRGFNQSKEFGSESQLDVNNYQTEKRGHDGNDNDGWEQNEFQGKVSGNETKYDVRPRNVNRGRGGDGRGYGGGNRSFGGQEGRFYDRQDGRNNRRGEVSNESESKENITGDIENAVKIDDYSGGAEWDVPVTTEGTTDVVHEQEKLEAQDDSEKKAKDTDENEGAKCYFAKHKLVWEVLEGGLKSKIEIQWSDIMALKANCPDNGPGALNVVLSRQPLFFRETNPQPRKHTLWQATADFTDEQASIHRQHFLQCPQGALNKHFEKLIQCDVRLSFLSQQPEIVLDSPYFEPRPSVFEGLEESKDHSFDQVDSGRGPMSGFLDVASSTATQSSALKIGQKQDSAGLALETQSQEAPSPSSVMDTRAIEGNGSSEVVDSADPRNWDQIKLTGLHPSMSMSDLMSHIGHCISEQMTSGIMPNTDEGSEYHGILENIAQYLLNDNQFTTASDDKSLMSRVNSLCCLLQKDSTTVQNSQGNEESCDKGLNDGTVVQVKHNPEQSHDNKRSSDWTVSEQDTRDVSGSRQVPAMSRKDSFGDLLHHLPRIASLPKFLFNISEEDGDIRSP